MTLRRFAAFVVGPRNLESTKLRALCSRSTKSSRARSSTRAAIRRSKSTACSTPGALGRAAVPSGASTGSREALELRDGDKKPLPRQGRAQGGRQRRALIATEVEGMDAREQAHDRSGHEADRRHRQQGEARRQRDPRRLARRRARRRRSRRPAALPLPRRRRRAHAARSR